MTPLFTRRRGRTSTAGMSFVGILLVFLLLLAACGSSGKTAGSAPAVATASLSRGLLHPAMLTVGSDTTYPPQEFIDTTTNKATGFDVDLITAMAQRMGLQANIVTTKFDTIIDDLNNKRFDVVISAITINPQRQQKNDFVPYFNAGESLLVQTGNPKNIKGVSDLCGQNVGVQTGTVEQTDLQMASDACKKAGKPFITLIVQRDERAVVRLLIARRVVATYQDSPVSDYYNKQHPGQLARGGPVVNAAKEGIAIRKGDTSMFEAIRASFEEIEGDGTYSTLIEKWGLTSGQISAIDRHPSFA